MGVHSRIESKADDIINKSIAGNTYINRDIVGAVVGSQPFGGTGLSGTGFRLVAQTTYSNLLMKDR